jgi:trehalose 6-phosphate synthase/phosphatase
MGSGEDRRSRVCRLRRGIRECDIFWWVDSYLQAAIERDLSAYPQPEETPAPDPMSEYVPI